MNRSKIGFLVFAITCFLSSFTGETLAESAPVYRDAPPETVVEMASLIAFDRYADAIRLGNRSLKTHLQDSSLYQYTALAYWRNSQTLSAQELLKRGLKERYSEELLAMLIRLQLSLGRDDEVLALWEKYKERVTEHSPQSEELICNVLLASIHLNRIKDGRYEFSEILKEWPQSYLRGRIYFYGTILNALAKRKPEALSQMRKALAAGRPPADFERDPDLKNIDTTPEFKKILDTAWKNYSEPEEWEKYAIALSELEMPEMGIDPSATSLDGPARERLRAALKEQWDVSSADDLKKTLAWLEQKGHRELFENLAVHLKFGAEKDLPPDAVSGEPDNRRRQQVVKDFGPEVGSRGILGWDFARLIALARFGRLAGYLSDDEAREPMIEGAREIQKNFSTWQEFSRNYLIGHEFRSAFLSSASALEFFQMLDRLRHDPESPWKNVRWKTALPDLPLPADPAKPLK